MVMMVIKRVVREHVEIKQGGDMSFGQILDSRLKELAQERQEVLGVEFEMDPLEWQGYSMEMERKPATLGAKKAVSR